MGYGWSHSYETRLVLTDNSDAGVVFGSGKELFFTWNSSQTFTPADGRIHDKLVKNGDGSYTFTTKANQRYYFTSAGVLNSIKDANNNTTTLLYNGAGQLTSVVAPGGATFTLAHDGNGRLVNVTDPLGALVSYAYSTDGDLVSATRPNSVATTYSYDIASRLTGLHHVQGGSNTLNNIVYALDANGNRDWMTDVDGLTDYVYDVAGALWAHTSDGATHAQR